MEGTGMGSERRAVVVTHSRLRESGTVVPEAVDQLRHAGFRVTIVDNVAAPRFGGTQTGGRLSVTAARGGGFAPWGVRP